MDARSVIAAVRDGRTPEPAALGWFARGLADGTVTDAQAGAFAMAVLCRGLSAEGRVALTEGMRDSGRVLAWDLPGPLVDKHSTGGIGDVTSLPLAPALAACGAYVPMISGRGLGHTGGTLDKLEAIPGFRTALSEAEFRAQVAGQGCAIVAASADLAPADRRLYAVRDVTSTVESIDLITASILSKKLAAGLEALVLDVKCGSGAFMKTREDARALAESLVAVAQGAGCRTSALVTDMTQPLAPAAGNAVEVAAALEMLTGAAPQPRLRAATIALGAEALVLCGLAGDAAEGAARLAQVLDDGRAAEGFARMVAAQGGPRDLLTRWPDLLPAAPVILPVPARHAGQVAAIDGFALGEAVVHLGGGRLRDGDAVDPRVGLTGLPALGDTVAPGDVLALVHAADEAAAARAAEAVQAACHIGTAPALPPLVFERVG